MTLCRLRSSRLRLLPQKLGLPLSLSETRSSHRLRMELLKLHYLLLLYRNMSHIQDLHESRNHLQLLHEHASQHSVRRRVSLRRQQCQCEDLRHHRRLSVAEQAYGNRPIALSTLRHLRMTRRRTSFTQCRDHLRLPRQRPCKWYHSVSRKSMWQTTMMRQVELLWPRSSRIFKTPQIRHTNRTWQARRNCLKHLITPSSTVVRMTSLS